MQAGRSAGRLSTEFKRSVSSRENEMSAEVKKGEIRELKLSGRAKIHDFRQST